MLVERVWTPDGAYSGGRRRLRTARRAQRLGRRTRGRSTRVGWTAPLPGPRRAPATTPPCGAPDHAGDAWTVTGDPTEARAARARRQARRVDPDQLVAELPRVAELDVRRRPAADDDAPRRRRRRVWVAVKGALEALAPAARSRRAGRCWLRAEAVGRRLRRRRLPRPRPRRARRSTTCRLGSSDAETGLRLPASWAWPIHRGPRRPRRSPPAAPAGITPVMITGDHPLTAAAIARRWASCADGGRGAHRRRARGARRRGVRRGRRPTSSVYARTNPEQKLRIVEAWQSTRRGRGDDRGRRQRRAGAAARRHRRRHGHHRHRGQQGSRRHGPRRRRLRDHRRGGRGGPPDLRQHPALRPLPADQQLGARSG